MARIHVLEAAVADQIAAGEVVERPASVVKELLDNAIDAGATRVRVELRDGGRSSIRVIDDGRGIHPADLELAVRRHATSKVRSAADLTEIHTLGFRGEALASVAAVADVIVRSRVPDAAVGEELEVGPERSAQRRPVGMPCGTQVEVRELFRRIPARLKFLRGEATEVAQCVETLLRAAIVHPGVHVTLVHGERVLVDLPATDEGARVAAVLARRGVAVDQLQPFAATVGATDVRGFLGPGVAASRARGAVVLVVRRRVVRDRGLAQVIGDAYGQRGLGAPSGYVAVDPPHGEVDVNVHPQKSEVRFRDPPAVYGAVREAVVAALDRAAWAGDAAGGPQEASAADDRGPRLALALASFAARGDVPASGSIPRSSGGIGARGYRLGTAAAAPDYASRAGDRVARSAQLRAWLDPRAAGRGPATASGAPSGTRAVDPAAGDRADAPASPGPTVRGAHDGTRDEPGLVVAEGAARESVVVLAALDPRCVLVQHGVRLLAVDPLRLRAHMVELRLRASMAGAGTAAGSDAPAQLLLSPVVVPVAATDVALVDARAAELRRLGLWAEPFGAAAIAVRAVPAAVDHCVEPGAVRALFERVLPWLRLAADDAALVRAIASAEGPDPTARLVRRWIAELALAGALDRGDPPGVRSWSASELSPRGDDQP